VSFTLKVDATKWRDHLSAVNEAAKRTTGSNAVGVIKGNGYGFGQSLLANEADRLGLDTVAVGTVFEIDEVLNDFYGDVIVLEPFEPRDLAAATAWWMAGQRHDASRLVRTVSSESALRALIDGPGAVRILLEAQTSMHRFGFSESDLLRSLSDPAVRAALSSGHVQVLGLSLHLPLEQPADEVSIQGMASGTARVREVTRWAGLWQAETAVWSGSHAPASTLWVSHLDDSELAAVARTADELAIRARTGTRLWLGTRPALAVTGTVLAVHPLPSGTHIGYRQRTGPKDSTLIVVSGGTAHGIGLAAPTPAASLRQRAVTAGTGVLDAAGRALSPFSWAGSRRWFAEPPHQHHSMLWLPRGCVIPAVGDQVPAEVRFTTSRFDAVIGFD
jgi:alanine racemase